MKLFDKEHRVGSDTCATNAKLEQNKEIENYMLFNMYKTNIPNCDKPIDKLQDFATNNHMIVKDGYGVSSSCKVDNDSQVRTHNMTNDRSRTQLFSRIFQAVPNLGRGEVNVEAESMIQQGENQYNDFECLGQPFDVFTPMLPCLKESIQDPNHIIPQWVRGGESTRDTLKQKEFLEKNGYNFDGNTWYKKQCGEK